MKTEEKKSESQSFGEYQLIFDKVEEAKLNEINSILFQETAALSSNIENIRKIVDSFNTPIVHITFTKV